MPFSLTEDHLRALFEAAQFETPPDEMIFFGVRGCVTVPTTGAEAAPTQQLAYVGVDYRHLRCTFGQWVPGEGFATFPGSTAPYKPYVQSHIAQHGAGANQLAFGYYRGDHRYYKGDHKLGDPQRRHRAFRNDSPLPAWRTGDDADYDGDDRLTYGVVYDNLHCAWQQNVEADFYSSDGCQVIVGRPRVPARGWKIELGPWARFVEAAYGREQTRFCYALFSGREVLALASDAAHSPPPTVRFGSRGPLVQAVQTALLAHGFDVGAAGADGDCSFWTIDAVRRFQLQAFGPSAVDLVVGAATAKALGMAWPGLAG